MSNYQKKFIYKITSKFLIIFYLMIHLFDIIELECQKEMPFRKYSQCTPQPCSKSEFESNNCYINNTIIKTQWLNNIIFLGELTFRYINFASYDIGDMIVETTSYPESNKRIFFGIKETGRPFFKNKINNGETLFYSIDIINKANNNTIGHFESVGLVVKHNDYKSQYYLSLPKFFDNAELFDFEYENIYYKPVRAFASYVAVHSLRHSFFPLNYKNNRNDNYYLFCFVGQFHNQKYESLFMQKHIFKGANWENEASYYNGTNEPNAFGKTISCFQTQSELIICFFMTKINEVSYLNLVKYDDKFENKKNSTFPLSYNDENIFFKAIHIRDELGVFSYYQKEDNFFPVLAFREFNIRENDFQFYFQESSYPHSCINLKKFSFNTNLLLNDIIKLTETKIVYSSTSENKEILYIIVLNSFGEKKISVRYYLIEIFSFYKYKILFELRIHKYNNFLAFGSSFCPNEDCDEDKDEHYSALMIFSYPNSTDDTLNLDKYLFDNNKNNINISNFEIDLKNKLKIENNIFGYVFSNITIKRVDCGEYYAYSSKNVKNTIMHEYTLKKDENIKIKKRRMVLFIRV